MTEMLRLMIVREALLEGQGALVLHPALRPWHDSLAGRRRRWFSHAMPTALEWYGCIFGLPGTPAAWLAARVPGMPESVRQCWVASPYHAVVGRDKVRIAPDEVLAMDEASAQQLAALLNPLLADAGMRLLCVGSGLLAVCDRVWDVYPQGFGLIAGGFLPNKPPEGVDAGRFSRLQTEIQMLLARKPLSRPAEKPPVSGLWFWGASLWPAETPATPPGVVSDDAALSGISGEPASLAIMQAEAAADFWLQERRLPQRIVLVGPDQSVLLQDTLLPIPFRRDWFPRMVKPFAQLRDRARP